jgi:predicted alpha/beta superfamily hydrolase
MISKQSSVFVFVCAGALTTLGYGELTHAQENNAQPVQLGGAAAGAVTIEGSERYMLEADHADQTYLIDVLKVGFSFGPPTPDQELPVIYVLDGNTFFPFVAQSADWLASITGEMSPALVVSIGYVPDESLSRMENLLNRLSLRTRDLTPTVVETDSPGNPGTTISGGGAGDFLAFINERLKPFIAARYPVNPDDQTLVGHSFGGLFAFYTLFNAPESFSRYVASSPSLWWDDRVLFENEESFAESHDDLSARVFVSVGSLESERMIGDAAAMAARLRQRKGEEKYSSLELTFQVLPDEHHTSVTPSAFMRGLREVFE